MMKIDGPQNPRRVQTHEPFVEHKPGRPQNQDQFREPKHRGNQHHDQYHDPNHRRPNHEDQNKDDRLLRSIKIDAPTFNGCLDPKIYIDWEGGMDTYFKFYALSDEKKCQFVQLRLTDQARLYWDQVERLNNQIGNLPITTWEAMKLKLRAKYVPPYY